MIQSLAWNDGSNMLAALADGKFTVWYYPNTIYVDRDLANKTIFEKEARYFHKRVSQILMTFWCILQNHDFGRKMYSGPVLTYVRHLLWSSSQIEILANKADATFNIAKISIREIKMIYSICTSISVL